MTEDTATALSIAEVARRLHVHPRTIYRLIERGELHGVKVGRIWRVPVAELERFSPSDGGDVDRAEARRLVEENAQLVRTIGEELRRRERAEAELRASRDQLQAILQSVADGITVQDPSGRLLYANDAAARLIGAPSVQALLQTEPQVRLQPYDVVDEAGAPVTPEALPGRQALRDKTSAEKLLRYRAPETGEEHWSNVRAVPVLDENGDVAFAVSAFQDVTPLKQAELSLRFLAEAGAALAASLDYAATLRTVTELAVPAIADVCVVDLVERDGQLQRFSVQVPDGVSEEPAWTIGKQPINPDAPYGPAHVLRTGESELLPEVTEAIIQGAARSPEHERMLRRIGITSHMIVPLRSRGEILGLITLVSTRSDRRYGQRDLEIAEELAQRAALAIDNARLYDEARAALAEARSALAVRDQFLAIASHELRTPLTSLKGHLDLGLRRLQRQAPGELVARSLGVAAGQVNRLNRLIGELLDVSRLSNGRLKIDPEPLEMAESVNRVVESERGIEPPRTIRLRLPAAPVPVAADPDRLEQVLVILLQNARKYSPEETPIRVTLRRTQRHAVLSVRDEGIGIPLEDRAGIFTPFHRAANVDRGVSGLGLGLYIAREIMQAHGGTLTVRTVPGSGSTFTATLPLTLANG